jgi:hypothetical protein
MSMASHALQVVITVIDGMGMYEVDPLCSEKPSPGNGCVSLQMSSNIAS